MEFKPGFSTSTTLQAVSIGDLAKNILDSNQQLLVVGVTSKGIFLKSDAGDIVFVSSEKYNGPYSILLTDPPTNFDVEMNEPVVLEQSSLKFSKMTVSYARAQIWQPQQPGVGTRVKPTFNKALEVLELVRDNGSPDSALALLEYQNENCDGSYFHKKYQVLAEALRSGNTEQLQDCLSGMIGFGRGLTPSGDDFIAGMALASARYGGMADIPTELVKIVKQTIAAAESSTTRISARLMEAALLGKADERILTAFDGYLFDLLDVTELNKILSSWGSSSGYDMFSGLAILCEVSGIH